MEINFYDNILRDLFIFIFRYLVGFFFIMQGIRGLKTGYDFVGEEMAPWIFKGGILIGFLIVILGSAFPAYLISIKLLVIFVGVIPSSYLSLIPSAFIISITSFYFYRYWKNYILDKKKEGA